MSGLNDAHLGSISYYLQSDKAQTSISDAHKIFKFDEIVEPDPHLKMLITLDQFECPKSFFNINSTNNTLIITCNSNTNAITLDIQNYNADKLASTLTTALLSHVSSFGSTISVVFSELTNTFKFSSDSNVLPFTIESTSTILKILGFNGSEVSASTGTIQGLKSSKIANLAGTPSIYIKINNLGIQNRDSRGESDGTVAKIMVDCNYGEFIFYNNVSQVYYPLSARVIKFLEIIISDSDGNELELNGADFSMVLTIHFQKIRERLVPQKYLLDKIKRLEETKTDKK